MKKKEYGLFSNCACCFTSSSFIGFSSNASLFILIILLYHIPGNVGRERVRGIKWLSGQVQP